MKYRKKPIVIEATQWDGTYKDKVRIEKEFPRLHSAYSRCHKEFNTVDLWGIKTSEGAHDVIIGDYIVKIAGVFSLREPKIFEETYEKVD